MVCGVFAEWRIDCEWFENWRNLCLEGLNSFILPIFNNLNKFQVNALGRRLDLHRKLSHGERDDRSVACLSFSGDSRFLAVAGCESGITDVISLYLIGFYIKLMFRVTGSRLRPSSRSTASCSAAATNSDLWTSAYWRFYQCFFLPGLQA